MSVLIVRIEKGNVIRHINFATGKFDISKLIDLTWCVMPRKTFKKSLKILKG